MVSTSISLRSILSFFCRSVGCSRCQWPRRYWRMSSSVKRSSVVYSTSHNRYRFLKMFVVDGALDNESYLPRATHYSIVASAAFHQADTHIIRRERIPRPAKKACIYIFSFASGFGFWRYFTRYCDICAILRNVDPVSFMRFIASLGILFKQLLNIARDLSTCKDTLGN